ncbi:CehA/McbA family metallohydrolase [Haloglomus litoreum]|uniref:CehA/McbA family metallohydrolase n=1 Tax=Haloglomus litoreum TaxID=3034026 RepID=UPI0023E7B8B6|nr:PHP domain-containing protein [Haloglomus sp. DT116]
MIRLDTHVHTRFSHDAAGSVRAVLAAARDAGLDGLAITDHDTVWGARRAARLASEYGLFVIPGVEVSTAEGHLLALGVEAAPVPGRPMAETVGTVRDRGGVAVAAHPFQVSRHGASGRTIRRAAPDAVETFNAHQMTGLQNRRARRFADRADYPAVGGSDAHRPEMVGRAYTEVRPPGGSEATDLTAPDPPGVDAGQALAAIRAGRTTARGRRTPATRYVGQLVHNATLRTGGGLAQVRQLLPR